MGGYCALRGGASGAYGERVANSVGYAAARLPCSYLQRGTMPRRMHARSISVAGKWLVFLAPPLLPRLPRMWE